MSTPVRSSDAKELRGGAYRFPPPRPASGDVILASDRLGEDAPAMDEPSRRRTQRSRQPCQTEVGRRFRFTVTGATRTPASPMHPVNAIPDSAPSEPRVASYRTAPTLVVVSRETWPVRADSMREGAQPFRIRRSRGSAHRRRPL